MAFAIGIQQPGITWFPRGLEAENRSLRPDWCKQGSGNLIEPTATLRWGKPPFFPEAAFHRFMVQELGYSRVVDNKYCRYMIVVACSNVEVVVIAQPSQGTVELRMHPDADRDAMIEAYGAIKGALCNCIGSEPAEEEKNYPEREVEGGKGGGDPADSGEGSQKTVSEEEVEVLMIGLLNSRHGYGKSGYNPKDPIGVSEAAREIWDSDKRKGRITEFFQSNEYQGKERPSDLGGHKLYVWLCKNEYYLRIWLRHLNGDSSPSRQSNRELNPDQ